MATKYPKGIKTAGQKAAFTKALNKELAKGRKEGYARRVAKGIAEGKTKQQARGHKEKEHIARAEREREEHGVSGSELKGIQDFLKRFDPNGRKGSPDEGDLVQLVQDRTYQAFQQYRKIWDAARRAYLREQVGKAWTSRGEGYLNQLVDMADIAPDGDEKWMYYH